MTEDLKPGLRHSATVEIDYSLTVPALPHSLPGFADLPTVFATAYLVALVESTCIAALKPFLSQNERSVGTGVNITHTAATPIGFRVTAEVELIEVDGRRLRFRVECKDDAEVIGEGFHDRFIIDVAKFIARLKTRSQRQ